MDGKQVKKINRRDALKLLGAATGAAALSNLPTKWHTPELASGVIPAHAQTSVVAAAVCTQNSLVGTFLAVNGNFQSNGVSLSVPFDASNIAGGNQPPVVGNFASWNCNHVGCFLGTFRLDTNSAVNPLITMQFATFLTSVVVTWNTATPNHTISVNFVTGAISVDGCAPGCSCN